jgi:hypothetical protein
LFMCSCKNGGYSFFISCRRFLLSFKCAGTILFARFLGWYSLIKWPTSGFSLTPLLLPICCEELTDKFPIFFVKSSSQITKQTKSVSLCKLIHVEESYFFMNMLNSESGHKEKGPELQKCCQFLIRNRQCKNAAFF